MGRKALVAAGLALGLLICLTQVLRADPPTPYRVVDPSSFVGLVPTGAPVIRDFFRRPTHHRWLPGKEEVRPGQISKVVPIDSPLGSTSIAGTASWYCRAGISICHHAYPAGSMVAAACSKLRRAMGPHWRGTIVTVKSGNRSVVVKLVDFCASRDKLIDLYWEPMRRLGGRGTLPVRVSW